MSLRSLPSVPPRQSPGAAGWPLEGTVCVMGVRGRAGGSQQRCSRLPSSGTQPAWPAPWTVGQPLPANVAGSYFYTRCVQGLFCSCDFLFLFSVVLFFEILS